MRSHTGDAGVRQGRIEETTAIKAKVPEAATPTPAAAPMGAVPVHPCRVKPDLPGDMPEDAKGTLNDRLAHVKWDVRAYAFQEVACHISELSSAPGDDKGQAGLARWEELTASVSRGLFESNVAVLDKALNAAQQLLYYAPIPLCQQLSSSCAEVHLASCVAKFLCRVIEDSSRTLFRCMTLVQAFLHVMMQMERIEYLEYPRFPACC